MSRAKNSLMIINSASNHSNTERQPEDFYATPPKMVRMLLDYFKWNPSVVWEPANGMGHISNTIQEICPDTKIIKTDIVKRTDDTVIYDFLSNDNIIPEIKQYEDPANPGTYRLNIITNPPYFKGTEFLEKACQLIAEGYMVAFFVKLQYLETKKRYEIFKKYPPYKILVSVQRVHCGKDGVFDNDDASGGAACYCWYVYQKGYNGPTTLDWINTGDNNIINPLF